MTRKAILVVLGVVSLVMGAAVGAFAFVVFSTFDSDGRLHVNLGRVDVGSAHTVVIDIERFSAEIPYLDAWGSARLVVSAGGRPLFAGIAGTPDADALLQSHAYTVARRASQGWETLPVPGNGGPVSPQDCAAQEVWLVAAQGPSVELEVPESRPITLLLAADGPLRVLDLGADVVLSQESLIVAGGGVAAGVLLVLGAVLVIVGAVLPRRRGDHEAAVTVQASVHD